MSERLATTKLVVITAEELSTLIKEAVQEALSSRAGERASSDDAQSELLDRVALAKALDCSPGHVDKERRSGMPCIYLGDSPRFELQACIDWLRVKGRS